MAIAWMVSIGLWTLVAVGRPASASAQDADPGLGQYLARMGISAKEREAASRGRAVARLLHTADNRDVAVIGIIGVNVPRHVAVAHVLDIERFLAASGSPAHRFATPPSPADVREAAFANDEYRALRDCRRGDCDFKLPASAMKGFAEQVDWSARDAKAQADARLRDGLLRLVTDYMMRGNEAMLTYDDGHGVNAADAFGALLAQFSDLYTPVPELQHYLTSYPANRPDGARDLVYWSEDRLPRLRPTLTVNHVVAYAPPAGASAGALVARKQIYASHYFEGALELLAVVGADGADGASRAPGAYLLTVRRFRFDHLPGGLLNIRGRVRRQMVDATRADLERQRSSMQQAAVP
jgi:hypothetical protein